MTSSLPGRAALPALRLAVAAGCAGPPEGDPIEVGKRADFVVLSGAVPDPPSHSILDLRVDSTWLGGAPTYRAEPER